MKMEIIVTSSDKHITEAFASIVVASGNIARQATNFDQLVHLYKDVKADLALVDEYGELLGCHIIGKNATNLISEVSVAKNLETTYYEIDGAINFL